jgi:ATP-dependent Lhr-like helicase
VEQYDGSMLDMLCLTGEVGWARLSSPTRWEVSATAHLGSTTPIALFRREHGPHWRTLGQAADSDAANPPKGGPRAAVDHPHTSDYSQNAISSAARRVLDTLRERGASFSRELATWCELDDESIGAGLGELVAVGLVASDGFAGLRAILRPSGGRARLAGSRSQSAGRWSVLQADGAVSREQAVETQAWSLLRRYGVVFRRLLAREATAVPWRELTRVYRRLEARGEIRGGRFVSGMSGEQFALPDAVSRLREVRRMPAGGHLVAISAADPLNLTGMVTSGERVRAVAGSRVVYRDGVALAALEGDYMRPLTTSADPLPADVASALGGRRLPAVASGFIGR